LDGTLVDSVYAHVLAWHEALNAEGIELSVWRIHRKIGMSGGLFTNMLLRETGVDIDPERIDGCSKPMQPCLLVTLLASSRYLAQRDCLPISGTPTSLLPSLRAAEWRRHGSHWKR